MGGTAWVHACRVQEHTLLPNETVYTDAFFPLDLEEDLYVVGFYTKVVNAVHLHHFVVSLCTEGIEQLYDSPQEPGFPQQPASAANNGADAYLSLRIVVVLVCLSNECGCCQIFS